MLLVSLLYRKCYGYVHLDTMAGSILHAYLHTETNKGDLTDLHYFDGLANQDEVIRLTIGTLRDVQTTANVIDTPTDNAEGRGKLVEDAVHALFSVLFYRRWRRNTACELHGTDLNQLFDCMATVNCNENLMAVDGSRTLSLGVSEWLWLLRSSWRTCYIVIVLQDTPAQFSQILKLMQREFFKCSGHKPTIRDIWIIT